MPPRLQTMLEIHSCAEKGLMAIAALDEEAHSEEIIRELLMHLKMCTEAEIKCSIPEVVQ